MPVIALSAVNCSRVAPRHSGETASLRNRPAPHQGRKTGGRANGPCTWETPIATFIASAGTGPDNAKAARGARPGLASRRSQHGMQPKRSQPSLLSIMLRKIAIGLTATAIAMAGSTADASTRYGSGAHNRRITPHSTASAHRRTVPKSHGTVTPYVVTDRNWLSTSGFRYNRPYGYWPPPQKSQPLGMEGAH